MKIEPELSHDALIERVQALYDLPVESLTFIPEGECSLGYAVQSSGKQEYFLKLWAGNRQGQVIRAKLDVFLPLTRELFQRNLLTNIPAPVPTSAGMLHSTFAGYALALFPWMEGTRLADSDGVLTKPVRQQIAVSMASLHRATGLLTTSLPRQPAFEVDFAREMVEALDALDAISAEQSPGQVRLRALLIPHRAGLLAELARLERYQQIARRTARDLVLCHTDMGGNNVLVDASGRVSILDWDDLILAPPEQDLAEYRGEDFAGFLKLYCEAGGVADLDPAQFAFYLLRRYLGDLTDWMVRILVENTSEAQDAFDLEGIEGYSLARLASFDREMQEITATIESVRAGR